MLDSIPTSQEEFFAHPEACQTFRLYKVIANMRYALNRGRDVTNMDAFRASWWSLEEDPEFRKICFVRSKLVQANMDTDVFIFDVKITHYLQHQHYAARLNKLSGKVSFSSKKLTIMPIEQWVRYEETDEYYVQNVLYPGYTVEFNYDRESGYDDIRMYLSYIK